MTTLSARSLVPTFLPSLNDLLAALALPFTLDHPTDLTPSLLLAIFESLINARLPIPPSVRQSRTREAKSRAMLVLLGVLECDVLRGGTAATDADAEHSIAISNVDDSMLGGAGGVSVDGWVDEIGLGEVDPERLADGGWEETIFVGELLCWLARRKGILSRTKPSHRSSHSRSLYSNHHSYVIEEGEGETADFSTSLLLRPSTAQMSRSPRPPSPSPSIDPDPNADFSTLSHITDVPRHPLVHSPEPSLSASATTGTDLSIRARSISSRTSVSNAHDDLDEFEEASQDTVQMYDPLRMMQDAEEEDDRPPTFRPRCIHELEDPSYIRALAGSSSSFNPSMPHEHISEDEEDDPSRDEDDDADGQDNDDLYAPPTPTPRRVRLTGWIDSVDVATELSHFAASRSHSHSWSRAFNPSAGVGPAPPSQLHSHKHARTGELTSRSKREVSPLSRPVSGTSRTPRRASPPPSPPPSPLPSTSSSKHPPPRLPSSPPPSPPSPTIHSDPAFDISFSTLNNTSTPAKPRPPRRPQFQKTPRHETDMHVGVDRSRSGGSLGTGRRDRSPSYTPSPPSFSTPGSLRSGGPGGSASGTNTGTRVGSTGSSGAKTRLGAPAQRGTSPALPLSRTKGTSPAGSTTTTNTLLNERARLLTELAALKRVRAASGAGTGGGGGVVSHRVGVGV
ncbi:hypothetical protein J3R82DRAFT_9293 [Butyriboletus roseoflavus]|nr:hypothetical protein J3R82DRAFT_9293 [Butyriboletus roseoflavus]